MESMISVAAMSGWLETVSAAGKNPAPILAALGLDRAVLANPEAFVPSAIFARLLEESARQTGDDVFGLHFGERFNPKNIGPLAYVVIHSPTIIAGIENGSRYLKVHNQAATTSLEVEGERVYIRHRFSDLGLDSPRQHNEYSMAVMLNTARLVAGSDWTPREVHFAHHSPIQVHEHRRIFGAPVLFGCATNARLSSASSLVGKYRRRTHDFIEFYSDIWNTYWLMSRGKTRCLQWCEKPLPKRCARGSRP